MDRFEILPSCSHYEISNTSVGIVHLGFGAFHRSHQAPYIDQMMEVTGDLRWGIAAVNLRAQDSIPVLKSIGLPNGYVLKTVASDGTTKLQCIRSILEYHDWSSDPEASECLLENPKVQIVTITVTESGYFLNDQNALDLEHPVIKSELAGGQNKSTLYAYLTAALVKRQAAAAGPITIICCDNLRGNGNMLASNLKAYVIAAGLDELHSWIDECVSFPNTMVDRITPKPTKELEAGIERTTPYSGAQSVLSEDFIQWVIEDNFAAAKPPLERAGVLLVNNVHPYEEAKVRILNGGHTCLAYFGVLFGYETFDQAFSDPVLSRHFQKFETEEVLPALGDDSPINLPNYLNVVDDRFRNAFISDTLERICSDGVTKFQVFVRPTVRACFERNIVPVHSIKTIASWYVFLRLAALGHVSFDYVDHPLKMLGIDFELGDIDAFVSSEDLWGSIPNDFPKFGSILRGEILNLEHQYLFEPEKTARK